MDLYQEVADRMGMTRNDVKMRVMPLFYSNPVLPESEDELIDFLVVYLGGSIDD